MPQCIFVVYVIRNLVNGKRYVGKTRGRSVDAAVKKRWASHLTEAKKERGYLLHRAIRKHGSENFTIGAVGSSKTEAGARKAAREAGQKHYSGNACKQGHGTLRYVSTWQCVECHRLWQMNYMPQWRQNRTEMHHV